MIAAASSTDRRKIAGIVVGNLIPVLGVLFLHWDAGAILILYWIENFIVGAFTVPRILTARGPPSPLGSAIGGTSLGERLFTAAFFCVHYGVFWIGHGVFALLIAGRISSDEQSRALASASGPVEAAGAAAQGEAGWSFVLAIAALIVIHAVGFWRDWIKTGLYRTATPNTEMFRPYGRLVVLHLTVLLGAFALTSIGAPAWTMIILCVGKMALELAGTLGVGLLQRGPVDRST